MTATIEPSQAELLPSVRNFLSGTKRFLVGGQWVESASGETFETIDPATGQVLTTVARGGAEDVDRAVRAARAAFDEGPWATMKPNERERLIWRVGDILSERAEEFGQLEALDNGKSVGHRRGSRRRLVGRHLPLLRGLGHQDRGQHGQRVDAVRPRWRVPRVHAA